MIEIIIIYLTFNRVDQVDESGSDSSGSRSDQLIVTQLQAQAAKLMQVFSAAMSN